MLRIGIVCARCPRDTRTAFNLITRKPFRRPRNVPRLTWATRGCGRENPSTVTRVCSSRITMRFRVARNSCVGRPGTSWCTLFDFYTNIITNTPKINNISDIGTRYYYNILRPDNAHRSSSKRVRFVETTRNDCTRVNWSARDTVLHSTLVRIRPNPPRYAIVQHQTEFSSADIIRTRFFFRKRLNSSHITNLSSTNVYVLFTVAVHLTVNMFR